MSALSWSRRTSALSRCCRVTCSLSSRRTVRRLQTSRARPSRMARRSRGVCCRCCCKPELRSCSRVVLEVSSSCVFISVSSGVQVVQREMSDGRDGRRRWRRGDDTKVSSLSAPARWDEWIGCGTHRIARTEPRQRRHLERRPKRCRYAVRTPTGPAVNAIVVNAVALVITGPPFEIGRVRSYRSGTRRRKRNAGTRRPREPVGADWPFRPAAQPAAMPGTAVARDMNRVTFSSTMMSLGRSGRVR